MTDSEITSIKLLKSLGAQVSIIPTESKEKKQTPDMFVFIGECEIVVEVKEITVNKTERMVLKNIESGIVDSVDKSQDFKRYSAAIRSANKQLKTKCNGRSGIVLLQDLRGFLMRSIDPQQSIHQAMFGEEMFWITQPLLKIQKPPKLVLHIFGGGRTINSRSNTTTSAVGLIRQNEGCDTCLWLHHNPFATTPLPVGTFHSPLVREFVVASTNRFAPFSEVVG